MKKTIWNASLEESMNLVTDKYIQASMKDINENGYWRKILGALFLVFVEYLFYLLGFLIEKEKISFLFMKPTWVLGLLFCGGLISTFFYFNDIRKIKHYRILSQYYYGKWFIFAGMFFSLQVILLTIMMSSSILGWIASLVYIPLYSLLILERIQSIRLQFYGALYEQKELGNRIKDFIEKLLVFSKKYGGYIVLLLLIFRWIFPVSEVARQSDFVRSLALIFAPVSFIPGVYIVGFLVENDFPGYYLKKYLEDYRQFGDYSLEDWYGQKSKIYKEKMKNNNKES